MAKCIWCANMVCGDANWCEARECTYSDSYLSKKHDCKDFRDCGISALSLVERKEQSPKQSPYDGMERLF